MQGLLALHLDKILFRELDKDMQRYQAFSKRQSDTRISKGDNVPIKDVFSFLIDAKDPETGKQCRAGYGNSPLKSSKGSGFDMPELVGEASLLITGGNVSQDRHSATYSDPFPLQAPIPPPQPLQAPSFISSTTLPLIKN